MTLEVRVVLLIALSKMREAAKAFVKNGAIKDRLIVNEELLQIVYEAENFEDAQRLVDRLGKDGYKGAEIIRDRKYSEREMLAAPWLLWETRLEPRIEGSQRTGTKFDLAGACPNCGIGAIQAGPLVIDAKKEARANDPVTLTESFSFVLNQKVAMQVEDAFEPNELTRCVDSRGKQIDLWQVTPTQSCGPWKSTTFGYVAGSKCPTCHRETLSAQSRQELYIDYDARSLPPARGCGVARTHELFGDGFKDDKTGKWEMLPLGLHVISQKVYRALAKACPRAMRFVPVEIAGRG